MQTKSQTKIKFNANQFTDRLTFDSFSHHPISLKGPKQHIPTQIKVHLHAIVNKGKPPNKHYSYKEIPSQQS